MLFSESSYKLIQFAGTSRSIVALYKSYTFSFNGPKRSKRYLFCSRKKRNECKARLHIDEKGKICFEYTEHNHPPPVLKKRLDGTYCRTFRHKKFVT